MKEIKLNLIVDGNYILNKLTFTLHKNKMLPLLYDSLLKTTLEYRKLYPFNSIKLVSDLGGSWRKDLYIDYKGNRSSDSNIDWDYVYHEYDRFKTDIKNHNIKVYQEFKVEGDDWITYLVNLSNRSNISNMIISSDYDLSQLLTFNNNDFWCNLMYNDNYTSPKILIPKSFDVFLNEVINNLNDGIFNINNNDEFINFIDDLKTKVNVVHVNNIETLIVKMISGDSSDNIKSVFYKTTKTNKLMGIGEASAKKIYHSYIEEFGDIDLNDPDLYENISDLICEVKKIDISNMDIISNNLKFNRKLISLDVSYLPNNIIDKMNNHLL